MTIGIIPNITKSEVNEIIERIISEIVKNDLDYVLSDSILNTSPDLLKKFDNSKIVSLDKLSSMSDMVVSIGGDGTMLNTAYSVR